MRKLLILAALLTPLSAFANSRTGTMRALPIDIPQLNLNDPSALYQAANSRTGTLASIETGFQIANSRTGTMKRTNDQVRFQEELTSGEIRFQVATSLENAQTFVLAPNEFSAAEQVYLKALNRSKSLQVSGAAGWVEVASDRQGGGGL